MSVYTGSFTFIHKDAQNLDRNPQEDFVITSHVSGTYRKWSKDQRNKRLKRPKTASAQKAAV